MQMFSIARERKLEERGKEQYLDEKRVREIYEQTVYLRLEPNGNVMWTKQKELASSWEHAEAEYKLQYEYKLEANNCYLVEAVKSETV